MHKQEQKKEEREYKDCKDHKCNHRFHLIRVRPEIMWGLADKYLAVFVCEKCGHLRKIRLKNENSELEEADE